MLKHKNILLLLVILVSFSFEISAQTQVEIDIQEAAQAYFNAKLCNDYETLLGYTYPDVVEKAGGPENVKKALVLIQDTQIKKGMLLQQYKIKPPLQLTKTGEETHAIVPVTTISKVPGGIVTTDAHIIAVRSEDNSRWYIIETTSLDDGNISKVLASWDNSMMLPFKKAPIFKEDK
ncbi:hypothetical protein [Aquiflexum sp.]|uniref:hypothetical protein n=1 Tax=Aquiflexum sp. TaxID=1872584 RepID=UPI0035936BB1